MRMVFGGGGEVNDERPLLNVLGQRVEQRALLYIPIASDPPYEASLERLGAALCPTGVSNIAIVTALIGGIAWVGLKG